MSCARPFLAMDAAPFDGTAVEVQHGPDQEVAIAYWNGRLQGWPREGDPTLRVLHQVTGWRPKFAKRAASAAAWQRPMKGQDDD